jgi:hexokinase
LVFSHLKFILGNTFPIFKDIKVKVCVLINDTVGSLMSTAYYDRKTAIGLVLGTCTNACYIESVKKIDTLENYQSTSKEVEENVFSIF